MFNIVQQTKMGMAWLLHIHGITNYLFVRKIVPPHFPLNGFVHLDCLTIHVL